MRGRRKMAKGISIYPQTYSGYDQDGNCVITRKAESAEATYISPNEVRSAIENIKKVVNEGLKQIASSIEKVECGKETLVVADKTMQPIVAELAAQIAGQDRSEIAPLAIQIENALEEIYERACDAHDDIQKQLNSQAESACWVASVTRVR